MVKEKVIFLHIMGPLKDMYFSSYFGLLSSCKLSFRSLKLVFEVVFFFYIYSNVLISSNSC